MADIGISIAAKVAKYLVNPAIRQARYLFCLNNIVEDLGKEKENLIATRKSVQERVKEAINQTDEIDTAVEKWLQDVDSLLRDVLKLEEETRVNGSCFLCCCPNWRWGYRLSKQVAKKKDTMIELSRKSQFSQLSRPAKLPGIEYFSSGNFVYFESTKSAYNEILDALKDYESYMIGLYGMGGSGKTTLVKEMGKKAKKLKLFDQVIFVVVSQTPDVRRIQGEIADALGLKMEEETEQGRAQRIWRRLSNDKRILLILDDVWTELNFEAIGIPFDSDHKGCKTLITTCRRHACTAMKCQRTIQLSLLTEEEAWALFQRHAGTIADSSILYDIAHEVTRQCKGLPIAITTVRNSLRGKIVDEWKVASQRLKGSKLMDIEEGARDTSLVFN